MTDKPNLFSPQYYPINLDVPTQANKSATQEEKINNKPFLLKSLKHQILGATLDLSAPSGPGVIYQDGQYLISIRDERKTWQKNPMAADLAFGSVRHGRWAPFDAPISFDGNANITIDVLNLVDRTASQQDIFKVQVLLIGVEEIPISEGV